MEGGEWEFPWLKKTGKHGARLCYHKPPKPTDFILASASSLFPMEQKSPRVSGGWKYYMKGVRGKRRDANAVAFPRVCSQMITQFRVRRQIIKTSQGPDQSHLHWEMQPEMDGALSCPYASPSIPTEPQFPHLYKGTMKPSEGTEQNSSLISASHVNSP